MPKLLLPWLIGLHAAFLLGCDAAPPPNELPDGVAPAHVTGLLSEPDMTPISVVASCDGYFGPGGSWYLSVNSAGQAELTKLYTDERRAFTIPPDDWAAFRKSLADEKFFELEDAFGDPHVLDSSTTTVTIVAGKWVKTVRTHYLDARVPEHTTPEVARALRINGMVRGWFEDGQAADLRPYHQKIIEAAQRRE